MHARVSLCVCVYMGGDWALSPCLLSQHDFKALINVACNDSRGQITTISALLNVQQKSFTMFFSVFMGLLWSMSTKSGNCFSKK